MHIFSFNCCCQNVPLCFALWSCCHYPLTCLPAPSPWVTRGHVYDWHSVNTWWIKGWAHCLAEEIGSNGTSPLKAVRPLAGIQGKLRGGGGIQIESWRAGRLCRDKDGDEDKDWAGRRRFRHVWSAIVAVPSRAGRGQGRQVECVYFVKTSRCSDPSPVLSRKGLWAGAECEGWVKEAGGQKVFWV